MQKDPKISRQRLPYLFAHNDFTAETQPKLQPAFLRLSAIISGYFTRGKSDAGLDFAQAGSAQNGSESDACSWGAVTQLSKTVFAAQLAHCGCALTLHARSKGRDSSYEHAIPKIVHDPASCVERRGSDCCLPNGRFCSLL